jgi:hypothetical protein
MIYTVIWQPDTENDLADEWLNAPDRAVVTQAANQIDAQLKADPYANSESRSGNSRVMFVPPLGVAYDVSDDDCLVIVAVLHRGALTPRLCKDASVGDLLCHLFLRRFTGRLFP